MKFNKLSNFYFLLLYFISLRFIEFCISCQDLIAIRFAFSRESSLSCFITEYYKSTASCSSSRCVRESFSFNIFTASLHRLYVALVNRRNQPRNSNPITKIRNSIEIFHYSTNTVLVSAALSRKDILPAKVS